MSKVKITRLVDGPIVHAGLDPSIGANIQGPSLIRVPDWVENPLGRYYLYFADHKGSYIRLAYADDLLGPWRIHVPGSLQLSESHFLTEPPAVSTQQRAEIEAAFAARGIEIAHDVIEEVTAPHVASPDVHVDYAHQRIVMYYHGLEDVGRQVTRVATSSDGINFTAQPQVLGRTYLRVFDWQGDTYPFVSDVVNSSPTPDNSGSRDVTSLYTEFAVPLHATLDLQLALRYEDFSDVGSTTVGKIA